MSFLRGSTTVVRRSVKARVVGSIPTLAAWGGEQNDRVVQWEERLSTKQEVAGSSPAAVGLDTACTRHREHRCGRDGRLGCGASW